MGLFLLNSPDPEKKTYWHTDVNVSGFGSKISETERLEDNALRETKEECGIILQESELKEEMNPVYIAAGGTSTYLVVT
jgi:hypothetical protein